ncbi:PHOTOSYSTEM II 10 KDA POLYPEPTIDE CHLOROPLASTIC [Salix koriyanagi]|uniref:Photosystem II 10 kDa polypeptide, chloroplastic n=1 Tax=Salix koriyanagi TaxID=2511006 RepID=A0A9Q0X0L3_9ROSI|nr:PHOTOSYSTEM II 10 KDA POLYPEPTIDE CHLOROPLASTIC [Salix koriyanagi]
MHREGSPRERVCTNLSTNMVLMWMDGYSPFYNADEWSPSGDVYAGGKTGLLIWAVTLAGILAGDALLVYSTSGAEDLNPRSTKLATPGHLDNEVSILMEADQQVGERNKQAESRLSKVKP